MKGFFPVGKTVLHPANRPTGQPANRLAGRPGSTVAAWAGWAPKKAATSSKGERTASRRRTGDGFRNRVGVPP